MLGVTESCCTFSTGVCHIWAEKPSSLSFGSQWLGGYALNLLFLVALFRNFPRTMHVFSGGIWSSTTPYAGSPHFFLSAPKIFFLEEALYLFL